MAQSTKQTGPNQNLKLDFDYENLTGDEFTRYQNYIDSLAPTDAPSATKLDFDLHKAYPAFRGELKSGELVGVVIPPDSFQRTVRIEVRHARDHNRQITSGQGIAGQGTFYLLSKN